MNIFVWFGNWILQKKVQKYLQNQTWLHLKHLEKCNHVQCVFDISLFEICFFWYFVQTDWILQILKRCNHVQCVFDIGLFVICFFWYFAQKHLILQVLKYGGYDYWDFSNDETSWSLIDSFFCCQWCSSPCLPYQPSSLVCLFPMYLLPFTDFFFWGGNTKNRRN